MDDVSEGDRSIEEDRPKTGFFGWLILPLLSFCANRNETTCDEAVIKGDRPIESQPEDSSSIENFRQDSSEDLTYPEGTKTLALIDDPSTKAECVRIDDVTTSTSEVVSNATSSTQYVSESGGSIGEEGSSTEPLKITDLPMLPLLMICGLLMGDGSTSRVLSEAANSYLQNSKTRPMLNKFIIVIADNSLSLLVSMPPARFVLHAISRAAAFKKLHISRWNGRQHTTFGVNFDLNIDGTTEFLAEMLIYDVYDLTLRLYCERTDIVKRICSNLKMRSLSVDVLTLTDRIGNLVVDLASQQSGKIKIDIVSYLYDLTNAPAFLEQVDSLSSFLHITNNVDARTPLGLSKTFWQRKLSQKLAAGARAVMYGHGDNYYLHRSGPTGLGYTIGMDLSLQQFCFVHWSNARLKL